MPKTLSIKGSLNSRLKDPGRALLPTIDSTCLLLSRLAYKASLVFNVYLVHILQRGLQFPQALKHNNSNLINQFFKAGLKIKGSRTTPKTDLILKEVWKTYFSAWPDEREDCSHLTRLIEEAAKTYNTVFFNHLKSNFTVYQDRFLRSWCETNGRDYRSLKWDIINSINRREKPYTGPDEEVRRLIEEHRTRLGGPDFISDLWICQNVETVVQYFYHLQRGLSAPECRSFSLAPVHRIKRHYIAISSWTLRELIQRSPGMKDLALKSESAFYGRAREMFDKFFRLNDKRKRYFAWRILTDGVYCSILYSIPDGKKVYADRKLIKRMEKNSKRRTIAFDPGRVNILFGVEDRPEGPTTYCYSRRQYYHEAGITKANARVQRWSDSTPGIREAEQDLSSVSTKQGSLEAWQELIEVHLRHYDLLWRQKTTKRWSRDTFRLYTLKTRSMDRFINSLKPRDCPEILYGASKVKSGGQGEMSVPTTGIYKRLIERLPRCVILTNEHRTSKVCAWCDGVLHAVHEDGREVRGLRWCQTCRKFLNRDQSAARNILRCHPKNDRPESLCSDSTRLVVPKFYLHQACRQGKHKECEEHLISDS